MSDSTGNYPVAKPVGTEGDSRFSMGLVIDVVTALQRHGFPPFEAPDLAGLQAALWRFVYEGEHVRIPGRRRASE